VEEKQKSAKKKKCLERARRTKAKKNKLEKRFFKIQSQVLVAHALLSGVRDQEDHGSKPALGK
jgi:hypothetical protein